MTTDSLFSQSLAAIDAALPNLGSPSMQAAILRVMAVAVAGTAAQRAALIAGLDRMIAADAGEDAPPPAPAPPYHPKPADFDPDPVIGTVAGELARGSQGWDQVAGTVTRCSASVTLCGLNIHAYPGDPDDPNNAGDYLNFNTEGGDCIGDVAWADVGRLRELMTMPGDPVAQLMALARAWCEEPQRTAA